MNNIGTSRAINSLVFLFLLFTHASVKVSSVTQWYWLMFIKIEKNKFHHLHKNAKWFIKH